MPVKIQLTDNLMLSSDSLQWIIYEIQGKTHKPRYFFANQEHALNFVLGQALRDSEAQSCAELLQAHKDTICRLSTALEGLGIRIVSGNTEVPG